MRIIKNLVIKIIRKRGFLLEKFPGNDLARRMKLIAQCHIDTLFDIGANGGQYASSMRTLGYTNRIISFEPLKKAFSDLEIASSNDENWFAKNYALGSTDMKSIINVAGNSFSSSILNMLPAHLNSAPESKYVAQEEIEIKKIDSIFRSFCSQENQVMIKIDTQGYEKEVIDGAAESLKYIRIIQLEMSLVPLYENEMLFVEMINYLDNKGFQLFSLENGFSDSVTGQLLQVDGIFVMKGLL